MSDSIFGHLLPPHKAEELTIELLINNDDWSYSDPLDGALLRARAEGIAAKDGGKYQLMVEGTLSWAQIRLLQSYLGMLLANRERLEGVRDGPWEGTKRTDPATILAGSVS
jgi:hypothetical protein